MSGWNHSPAATKWILRKYDSRSVGFASSETSESGLTIGALDAVLGIQGPNENACPAGSSRARRFLLFWIQPVRLYSVVSGQQHSANKSQACAGSDSGSSTAGGS